MQEATQREFGRLVPECAKRGIGKTAAYALVGQGLLQVFKIGSSTFVFLDSLLTLPERLVSQQAAESQVEKPIKAQPRRHPRAAGWT